MSKWGTIMTLWPKILHSYGWEVLRSESKIFIQNLSLILQVHPSNFFKVVSLLGLFHLFLKALISSSQHWHNHFLWEWKVKNVLHWCSLYNYHLLGNWKRVLPLSATPWRALLAQPKFFCFITLLSFLIFNSSGLFLFLFFLFPL